VIYRYGRVKNYEHVPTEYRLFAFRVLNW